MEARLRSLEWLELLAKADEHRVRVAGADLARVDQATTIVVADEEGADTVARAIGIGEAADHELLPLDALGLAPQERATRCVGLVGTLGDDAFEPAFAGEAEELGALANDVVAVADRARHVAGEERCETLLALFEGSTEMSSSSSQSRSKAKYTSAALGSAKLFCKPWNVVRPSGKTTATSPSSTARFTGSCASARTMAGNSAVHSLNRRLLRRISPSSITARMR